MSCCDSVARKDDVITLSTGEKIVPIAQESRINASPLVSGCVMFGREQEQAGLLVEVAADYSFEAGDEAALASFRNKIWCEFFLRRELQSLTANI